jgi:hypothetical protein
VASRSPTLMATCYSLGAPAQRARRDALFGFEILTCRGLPMFH